MGPQHKYSVLPFRVLKIIFVLLLHELRNLKYIVVSSYYYGSDVKTSGPFHTINVFLFVGFQDKENCIDVLCDEYELSTLETSI